MRLEAWQDLRQRIMAEGGIRPNSDYPARDIPRSVRRLRGLPPDEIASTLGYPGDREFMDALWHTYRAAQEASRSSRTGPFDLPRPVAPYDKDPGSGVTRCFDRVTGQPVPPDRLKSYRDALAQYHLHPEDKFLGGDFTDGGATKRRHVYVASVEYIGKEANRWEEQFYLGATPQAQVEYGPPLRTWSDCRGTVLRACQPFGPRALARLSGLSVGKVSAVLLGRGASRRDTLTALLQATSTRRAEAEEADKAIGQIIEAARDPIEAIGLRRFAEATGVDPSNLAKVLARRKKASGAMLGSCKLPLTAYNRTLGAPLRLSSGTADDGSMWCGRKRSFVCLC
ncbi:MAG: hypothetical protein M0Z66_10470 [Thermaerobacter sp.]|nr:hypothetical protein [Thermaerobacter sp.]